MLKIFCTFISLFFVLLLGSYDDFVDASERKNHWSTSRLGFYFSNNSTSNLTVLPEIQTQISPVQIAQRSTPVQVQTSRILAFKQIEGRPEWRQSILYRIANSQWIFYPDGSFMFKQPDNTLSPIRGKYTVSRGVIHFEGSSSSQVGSVGSNMAQTTGKLYKKGNTRMISMSYYSISMNNANINGIPFFSKSVGRYEFTVELR